MMRSKTYLLGLSFLAPSFILIVMFYFLPAILTGVFSFSNMSTSTGIGQGEYVLTPNLIKMLKSEGAEQSMLDAISRETLAVNEQTVETARADGLDEKFLDDIEATLSGETFKNTRALTSALKALPAAPRSAREIKAAAKYFTQTAINIRFEDPDDLSNLLAGIAPELSPTDREMLVERSYTGPITTTDNYVKLGTTPNTFRFAFNTILYVGVTLTIFHLSLGLTIALMMFYLPNKFANVFGMMWLLPRITPVVLYAILWKWFTWDSGFLPLLAGELGLPSFNYMKGSIVSAWIVMICVNGLKGASFGMIIFSGALRAIPRQQLWASEVDGANIWQQVTRIILPQMRWPILFVTSYQTLSLLSSYEEIWLTTDGGPGKNTTVWALEAFKTALSNYSGDLQYGLGASMAVLLVIIGLIASLFFLRIFKFEELVSKPKIEI